MKGLVHSGQEAVIPGAATANSAGHTPGPWVVDMSTILTQATGLKKNRTHGYGCGNDFIACLNDGEYHEYSDGEEQTANARLIAAAPELLKALQAMVLNDSHAYRDCHKAARAAIAKATAQ